MMTIYLHYTTVAYSPQNLVGKKLYKTDIIIFWRNPISRFIFKHTERKMFLLLIPFP